MEQPYNDNILDSYESTENALMDSFKAAALKVTTLYKDSLVQNRKAYAAGYQQALQDLYEFISTQPENGYIPVQNVLSFARQKNSQLTFEMGHVSSSTPHSNTTTTTATHNTIPPTTVISNTQQKLNPFSIDPQSQFTFTHDLPLRNMWDSAVNEEGGFNNKRRLLPPEVSFMGRAMNIMDNTWQEQSPFKRPRSRREEQQQLHQQQQQQQP